MTITASADGSALGNPGPTGWAWYVDDSCWQAGGQKHGTNNIGELTAVLELLRATKAAGRAGEDLVILCDSQYVINSVTKWMPGWKRKGWKKADGKPVLNVDLIKDIDSEMQGRSVRFEWVKGHAGHAMNEAADERARAAATAYQKGKTPDRGPGFAESAVAVTGGAGGVGSTGDAGTAGGAGRAAGTGDASDARSARRAAEVNDAATSPDATQGEEPRTTVSGSADREAFGDGDACATQITAEQAERGLLRQAAGAAGRGSASARLVGLLAQDPLLIDPRGREMSAEAWAKGWIAVMSQAGQQDRADEADLGAPQPSALVTRTVSPGTYLLTYEMDTPHGVMAVTSLWASHGSDLLLAHHRMSMRARTS